MDTIFFHDSLVNVFPKSLSDSQQLATEIYTHTRTRARVSHVSHVRTNIHRFHFIRGCSTLGDDPVTDG